MSFYDAHQRYRRAGWRFSVLSGVTVVALGLPLSVIVSPFVVALGLMVLDAVNLITPMPDPAADILRFIGRFAEAENGMVDGEPFRIQVAEGITVAVAMLVPGMVVMVLAWLCVRRLFMRSAAGAVILAAGARPPDHNDLEERQLSNLIAEMAIAAGVPPPRVMVLDDDLINAAVVGRSIHDVTLIVPRGLLDELGRAPTGALVADLLASVVNGDLRAALVIASLFQTFDLVGAVLTAPASRQTRRVLWRLGRLALRPRSRLGDGREQHYLAEELADVSQLGGEDEHSGGGLLTFPFFVASLAFSLTRMLLGGLLVSPVLAALWRRRRLLADATAVRLTRDPDALARAFEYLEERATMVRSEVWTHLFVVGPEVAAGRARTRLDQRMDNVRAASGGPTLRQRMRDSREAQMEYQAAVTASQSQSNSFMAFGLDTFIPRMDVRLRRLAAMGAQVDVRPARRWRTRARPPSSGGWIKTAALTVAMWMISIVLIGLLLVCGVMLLSLLATMIYLALLFQMLLLLPLVAGVRFVLRDLVASA